jgi:hypothetical protein
MPAGDITNEGLLFSAELQNADAEISPGPGGARRWKFNLTICNKSAAAQTVTLYRRLAGPTDRYLLKGISLKAGQTFILGPYALDNGQSLRGFASSATAVDLSADGFEEATA